MPIKIHHGAPGAYKTSGAVIDDLVPWAEQGRVVVTNVRGLESTKKFKRRFAKAHCRKAGFFRRKPKDCKVVGKGFELIHVDTETEAGKQHMRLWFKWAPFGCAFLIDEIQTIYPQKFTTADYKKLCYESADAALADDKRPEDVYIAFEKHRHYNWDFVVTAPSIRKVPPIVRDVSETAYYHSNKGKIGLKGLYLEAMHNPDDTGKTESSWLSSSVRRAPKLAFELYGSTSTGVVKDTEAGQNIFLQPRIVAAAVLFFAILGWQISKGNPLAFETGGQIGKEEESQGASEVARNSGAIRRAPGLETGQVGGRSGGSVHINSSTGASDIGWGPLADFELYVGGEITTPFIYVSMDDMDSELTSYQLVELGYKLSTLSQCLWKLEFQNSERWLTCRGPLANDDDSNALQKLNPFGS